MLLQSTISSLLPGVLYAHTLIDLLSLYDEADLAIDNWKTGNDFACPSGCGECCLRFIPDVYPVEADLIALYLSEETREPGEPVHDTGRPFCMLYDGEKNRHCPVYPVRPLTCRLFGFSSVTDKSGKSVFRLCRFMDGGGTRQFSEAEASARFGNLPPNMAGFGFRLQSIAGGTGKTPLHEALIPSLEKIRYLLSMARSRP